MSFAWLWGSDELADLALELVVTSPSVQGGDCSEADARGEHSTHSAAGSHVLVLHGSLLASSSPYFKSRLTTWKDQHRCSQKQGAELPGGPEQHTVGRGRGNGKGRRSKAKHKAADSNPAQQTCVEEGLATSSPEHHPAPAKVAGSSCEGSDAPKHLHAAYAHAHVHHTHGSGSSKSATATQATCPTAASRPVPSPDLLPSLPPSSPPRRPPAPSSSTAQHTTTQPVQPCPVLSPGALAAAQETALQAIAALERVAASAMARCMREAATSSHDSSIPAPHKVSMLEVLSEVEGWLHAPSPLQPAEVCLVQKLLAQAAVAIREQLSQPKHDTEHMPGSLVNLLRKELEARLEKELKNSHAAAARHSDVKDSSSSMALADLFQKLNAAVAAGNSSIRLPNSPPGAARQGRQTRSNTAASTAPPSLAAGAGFVAAGTQEQSKEADQLAPASNYHACCPSQFDSLQCSAWMSIAAWARLQHEQPSRAVQQLQPAKGGTHQATRPEAKKPQKPQPGQASHNKQLGQQQQKHQQQRHVAGGCETVSNRVPDQVHQIVLASGVKLHHHGTMTQSSQDPAQQLQQHTVVRAVPHHWVQLQEHCTEEQLPGVLGVLRYMYTSKLPADANMQELVQILLQADYWSVLPCLTACLRTLKHHLGREDTPLDHQCANLLSLLPPHLVTFLSDPQVPDPQLPQTEASTEPGTASQQQGQNPAQQGQGQAQPQQLKLTAEPTAEAMTDDSSEAAAWQAARQEGKDLMIVLQTRLLSNFGKAAAVARSSKLLSRFESLPYLFLHMWASLPGVLIDSEHTILLLLSRWVEVQQKEHESQRLLAGHFASSEQLDALSKLVRQGLLTSSFILQVLPHLHWYRPPVGVPNNTAQVMAQLAGDRLQRKDWEQALAKHGIVRRSQPGSTLTTHVSEDVIHNAWRAAPRGGTARVPLTTQYWGGYVWHPYLLMTHTKHEDFEEPQDPPGLGVFEVGLQMTCKHVPWLDALKAPSVLQPVAALQFTVQVGEADSVSAEHLLGGEPVGPKDVLEGEYFMDVHDLMDSHGDSQGRLKVVLSFQSIT